VLFLQFITCCHHNSKILQQSVILTRQNIYGARKPSLAIYKINKDKQKDKQDEPGNASAYMVSWRGCGQSDAKRGHSRTRPARVGVNVLSGRLKA